MIKDLGQSLYPLKKGGLGSLQPDLPLLPWDAGGCMNKQVQKTTKQFSQDLSFLWKSVGEKWKVNKDLS